MSPFMILILDEEKVNASAKKLFANLTPEQVVFFAHGDQASEQAARFFSAKSTGVQRPIDPQGKVALAESKQRRLAEALFETANSLNQSLNQREVLDGILDKVGLVVPCDAANIMLIHGDTVVVSASWGYENRGGADRIIGMVREMCDMPLLQRMVETCQPVVIPDTQKDPRWKTYESSLWIRSYVSVPIIHQEKTIGFLNLNSGEPNSYTDDDMHGLLAFASHAAIAINNAALYESAQREIADRKRAEEALQESNNRLEANVIIRTEELSNANKLLQQELALRMKAEEAVEEERRLLAERVEERTAELSSANASLAKAAQLKDAFLANMSHELRTPLSAILNISETLQEEVYGPLNANQMKSLKSIETSGQHLLSLINDILDLSKIGAGKLELDFQLVSVQDICQSVLQLVNPNVKKKGLILSSSIDPDVKYIRADHRRLKQILVNLLSNATKFTPAGGAIGLIVTGSKKNNTVDLTVWDNGIGIPEDKFQNMFKPFVQLDNSLSRQYEGTGLGLTLVHHLVELHSGSIKVESQVGKGSRFTVTLLIETDTPGGNSGGLKSGAPKGTSSLTGSQISYFLQEMGVETENIWLDRDLAPSLQLNRPDFILVDDRLVGSKMLEGLNQHPATRGVPVIIIGGPDSDVDQRLLPRHAGYLKVPFTRKDIQETLLKVTNGGTMSLVHKAIIIHAKFTGQLGDRKTILVVDKNENEYRSINEYLADYGFRVVRAFSYAEAVDRAREDAPHLILMDIQTSGLASEQAIEWMRSEPKIKNLPILAITALSMPGDRERCLKAGADAYFVKPLQMNQISEMIERLTMKK